MTVFDPNWIGLDGKPVTGRVPPQTVVHTAPGVELSREQQGALAHAYRLFCTAVSHSAAPEAFHTQNRVWSDGMRAKMVSHQGQHHLTVWIDGLVDDREAYRGFVIRPERASEVAVSWPKVATLMRFRTPPGVWDKWVEPYRPGKTGATPTYFVDEPKRTKARGVKVNEDTRYADVYTLSEAKLYRNGVPALAFVAAAAVPIPKRTPGLPVAWFALNSSGVQHLSASPALALTTVWDASVLTSGASGIAMESGVYYSPDTETAAFQRLLRTPAGALQRRQAEITLIGAAPWYSTTGDEFAQLNAGVEVRDPGGYTTFTTFTRDEPIEALRSNNARTIAGLYPWIITGVVPLTEMIYGADLITADPYTRLQYNRTITAPDNGSVEIFPGISAMFARAVGVSMTHEFVVSAIWYNAWPRNGIYNEGGVPGSNALGVNSYAASPALGGGSTLLGDRTTLAKYERGGKVDEQDTTTSTVSLSVGGTIYSASTAHVMTHTQLQELESDPPPPPSSIGVTGTYYSPDGGGTFFPTFWPFVRQVASGSYLPDYAIERRFESVEVEGTAKDYVFFDEQNNVFVWFETELSGAWTTQSASEGIISVSDPPPTYASSSKSLHIQIDLVLTSPHTGEVRRRVFTLDPDTPPVVNLILPENTNQDGSGRTFKYVTPAGVQPMFAPKWMHQGVCPHIAYTTSAEAASAAAAGLSFASRLLASFRLQIVLLGRSPLAELATIPDAEVVHLPMMEQLLGSHYTPTYAAAISAIESTPITLNVTNPGSDVQAAAGVAGTDPHSDIYRT